MKKVLSAFQMGEIDRLTTSEFGVPSIDLMENAANAVVDVIMDGLGAMENKRVIVLCGKGNNGGDGAAAARILRAKGAMVDVFLLGRIAETVGDAHVNFEKLVAGAAGEVSGLEIKSQKEIDDLWASIRSSGRHVDVIVDAVFGTGLDRPVEGIYKAYLEAAMNYAGEVSPKPLLVSIDLPSGVDSDKSEPIGFCFRPDVTVTFTAPKIANVMWPNSRTQGQLFIREIGSPAELLERAVSRTFLAEERDARRWLDRTGFSEDSYKKKRGNVLVIAGSKSYPGAAVLAGNGAMRSGAGIVTVVTPDPAYPAVAGRILPEVMVRALPATESGSFSAAAKDEIAELLDSADAVLIGPGITASEEETIRFVNGLATGRSAPVVIDADGLNALSPFEIEGTEEFPLILTPHEGEFRRLTGGAEGIPEGGRIESVRDFARRHGVICVLKGEKTLVASPEGSVVINATGNPGLGKAGNGDTLAGVITGFVAQEIAYAKMGSDEPGGPQDVFSSVSAAVYVAGLAGDIAAARFGKHVMTASDVRECLAAAFRQIGDAE